MNSSVIFTRRDDVGLRRRFALRCLAFALFAVYVGWNLLHVFLLQIPASLSVALAGIPCPTTGGTRALVAMSQGDVMGSLAWNPFAVPILLLVAASCTKLASNWFKSKRFRLSQRWLRCWMWLLGVAWITQLSLHYV